MSKPDQTANKVPRCHYYPPRWDMQKYPGSSVVPGHLLLRMVRDCAPDAAKTRETLLALRRDFRLPRTFVAALLASSESTVKTWERGTRSPSMIARRLIWLIDSSLRNKPVSFSGVWVWS